MSKGTAPDAGCSLDFSSYVGRIAIGAYSEETYHRIRTILCAKETVKLRK